MVSEKHLDWLRARLHANQNFLGRALVQCRSNDPAIRLLGLINVPKFNRAVAFWRRKIKEVTAAN